MADNTNRAGEASAHMAGEDTVRAAGGEAAGTTAAGASGKGAASAPGVAGGMEAERARRRASLRQARGRDEAARQAGLRAACEDDDGYDPYSDYMDALSRSGAEAPCADPWN